MPRLRVLAVAVLAVVGAGGSATPAAADTPSSSLLFVQETSGGELVKLAKDRYELRLDGVSTRVTTFTDRPGRRAGTEAAAQFVRRWASRGFRADPPNAALVVEGAARRSDVMVLELSRPRLDAAKRRLVYAARPVRAAAGGGLEDLAKRADPVRAGRFGTASLFIDDAGSTTVYRSLQVVASNIAPGQGIQLSVSGIESRVRFGSDPGSLTRSALQMTFPFGSVPLGLVDLSAQELVVQTSRDGAGGSAVIVTVSLAADADTDVVSLTSNADPGVVVTAQLEGQPQATPLGFGPSLLTWP